MIYSNVLVPLDGSELAECVLPHISGLAQKGLVETLTFVRVTEAAHVPTMGVDAVISKAEWSSIEHNNKNEAEKYLEQLTKRLYFVNVVIKWEVLPPQSIPDMISRYAKEKKADLIVIATHGRSGLSRMVWGSVAEHVLRNTNVPVFMVRSPGCGVSV
jgi:nucleotide-binding universal stress UspA family protein